jgi:ribosomal protein S18 acetylase RimI-like enzyme
VLRRARPEDGPAVAELFGRSFGTLTFLPALHTAEEDLAYFGEVVAEQEVWLWEEDGRVLGFAALDATTLNHIYVEPDAHRRGVGSALFAHAQARRPAGFRLWVFQRNENARRFYERRGMRVVELTDGSRNEEREPDALYEWLPG